jgi:lincosamide nucleotidyltransferase A/C/D/E
VERPPLWAKITDGVNAVVWRLPVPHRAKKILSGSIYRNPPMDEDRVVQALEALEGAGVVPCCIGGWGVDALVEEQTRKHRDLDLIVERDEREAALKALAGLGYRAWYEQTSDGFLGDRVVVRDRGMRVIDMHPVDFEKAELSIVAGSIGGRTVRCLSAEQQVTANQFRRRLPHERRSQRNNAEVARRALETESGSS